MMQRPVMNPMYLDDAPASKSKGRRRAGAFAAAMSRAGRLLLRVGRLLLTDVLRRRKDALRVDIGTPFSRACRAVLYRLMFVPAILAVMVCVLVAGATHPRSASAVMDPTSQGVYYDPVDLLSLDNTKLEGWLVPVVDARRIIVEREDALHRKAPAVVLVHDFGASRQQLLPLVAPLHDAGYVLLLVSPRGHGPSSGTGVTFGLNEAQDVRAAVELLRRRPFVDPDAIGVLGVGTGATAALIAAKQDARLNVLILDHPVRQFDDVLNERIGPKQAWLSWLRPMCKWTFELSYRVDAEDVNLGRFGPLMRERRVMMLDDAGEAVSCVRPVRQRQVIEFLKKHLVARNKTVTTLQQQDATGRVHYRELPAEAMTPDWPPQRPATELLEMRRRSETGW